MLLWNTEAHTLIAQMSDGSASPREVEPQFGITPTDFELEAEDPNGCMSPNSGKTESRNSMTNGAGAEVHLKHCDHHVLLAGHRAPLPPSAS